MEEDEREGEQEKKWLQTSEREGKEEKLDLQNIRRSFRWVTTPLRITRIHRNTEYYLEPENIATYKNRHTPKEKDIINIDNINKVTKPNVGELKHNFKHT